MSIEDERVRFYLKHRDDIERWAALRTEAAVALDGWLAAREPALRELANALQATLSVEVGAAGWPRFSLQRPSWPQPASIALEWARGQTTLGETSSPYVGLRLSKDEKLGQQVRLARPTAGEGRYATSKWWVAYRYCPPEADFLANPEAYEAQLVEALRQAWNDFAPLVDAAAPISPAT